MPDYITVTGVKPYDGRYELDLEQQPLTTREWRWVKQHADYLPLTLTREALSDPGFVVVQAVIAMFRAGRVTAADIDGLVERFQDVDPFAAITYEIGDSEGDADGPPPESSDSRRSINGDSSPNGSANPETIPPRTGHPASDTSRSDPQTLVT